MASPPLKQSIPRKVAFSAVTVVLVFALLEATLRVAGMKALHDGGFKFIVRRVDNDLASPDVVPDRRLFWRLRPDATFDLAGTPVRSNSQGFRTRETTGRPSAGVRRILYLGNSTTFGWHVEEADRYSAVVQRMLESVAPSATFDEVNLAVPGYTSFQSRRAFETVGRTLRPDVVVVCVGFNDGRPARDAPDSEVAKRIARPQRLRQLLGHLRLYRLVRTVAQLVRGGRRGDARVPRVCAAEYEGNLRRLAQSCRDVGAALVVLAFPYGRRLDRAPPETLAAYRDAAARLGEEDGVALVPMRSMTEACLAPNGHLFGDVVHPNKAGHEAIAAHLFKALAKLPAVEPLVERAGTDPRDRARMAKGFLAQGRAAEAIAQGLVGLAEGDNALPLLAAAYSSIGAYEDAICTCLAEGRTTVWSAPVCTALAEPYWRLGMPESAAEVLERGLHVDPGFGPARRLLEAYRLVLDPLGPRLSPESAAEFTHAIRYAMGQSEFAQAAELCRVAVIRYPDRAEFRLWHGQCLRESGERKAAYALLEGLSVRHQLNGDARMAAAECFETRQDCERGLYLVQAAARLKPFSWRTQAVLAEWAEQNWDYRVGVAAAQRALMLNPSHEPTRQRLVRLRARRDKLLGRDRPGRGG